MRAPARILVVDDNAVNVRLITRRLTSQGYEVVTAGDGESGLRMAQELTPDLILLDVMMPRLDGREVCRRLKADPALPFMPIIMVTALTDLTDVVAGLDAGADDYLTKPIDHAALEARVRSMLRIKELHDTVHAQRGELAAWNATLEQRVREQIVELEHVSRLKRFFSPQLAERIVAAGADDALPSRRRDITVVCVELRGFTAFAETSEPEEVSAVLREYHAAAGRVILAHEGTWERFTGDGMLVFFNDPIAVSDPEERAVRMTLALRQRLAELRAEWERRECSLDFAAGIASGYATVGAIGFEARWDYMAIGTVTNLAGRLCGEAQPDDVLASQRVVTALDDRVVTEPLGSLALQGFQRAVPAFRLLGLRERPPHAADSSAA